MGIFDDLNVISEVVSISFDNYDIETLVYDDSPNSENLFKLKIIKPKGIYQSEFAKEIWLQAREDIHSESLYRGLWSYGRRG